MKVHATIIFLFGITVIHALPALDGVTSKSELEDYKNGKKLLTKSGNKFIRDIEQGNRTKKSPENIICLSSNPDPQPQPSVLSLNAQSSLSNTGYIPQQKITYSAPQSPPYTNQMVFSLGGQRPRPSYSFSAPFPQTAVSGSFGPQQQQLVESSGSFSAPIPQAAVTGSSCGQLPQLIGSSGSFSAPISHTAVSGSFSGQLPQIIGSSGSFSAPISQTAVSGSFSGQLPQIIGSSGSFSAPISHTVVSGSFSGQQPQLMGSLPTFSQTAAVNPLGGQLPQITGSISELPPCPPQEQLIVLPTVQVEHIVPASPQFITRPQSPYPCIQNGQVRNVPQSSNTLNQQAVSQENTFSSMGVNYQLASGAQGSEATETVQLLPANPVEVQGSSTSSRYLNSGNQFITNYQQSQPSMRSAVDQRLNILSSVPAQNRAYEYRTNARMAQNTPNIGYEQSFLRPVGNSLVQSRTTEQLRMNQPIVQISQARNSYNNELSAPLYRLNSREYGAGVQPSIVMGRSTINSQIPAEASMRSYPNTNCKKRETEKK